MSTMLALLPMRASLDDLGAIESLIIGICSFKSIDKLQLRYHLFIRLHNETWLIRINHFASLNTELFKTRKTENEKRTKGWGSPPRHCLIAHGARGEFGCCHRCLRFWWWPMQMRTCWRYIKISRAQFTWLGRNSTDQCMSLGIVLQHGEEWNHWLRNL